MKKVSLRYGYAAILVLLYGVLPQMALSGESTSGGSTAQRILFIGNSYTQHMRLCLLEMLANSSWHDAQLEFIARGGVRLEEHLHDATTLGKIQQGRWDKVVLQEQSQIPALADFANSFHAAVDGFSEAARLAGATPVLYMTWGRRNGDAANAGELPDYPVMQARLSDAYTAAAGRNAAQLVPVGLVWSLLRQRNPVLWGNLYNSDNSHPSPKGSCVVAATFMHVLFADRLSMTKRPSALDAAEWEVVKAAILDANALEDD